MRILQAIDLLKYQLVRISVPETEEFEEGGFILLLNDRDYVVGKVVSPAREVPEAKTTELYEYRKKLTKEDLKPFLDRMKSEKERVKEAKNLVAEAQLPMNIFASRCDFEGKVFSFFFTSEDKIDFRNILRTMGKLFNARIHLQRVGSRDRAQILGGFGTCGREMCCSSFKVELDSVPVDAARDQNLMTRNNEKIFGLCGKLKCCLQYELSHYREMRKFLPHLRQIVITADKREGSVVGLDILNQKVKIQFEDADFTEIYDAKDIQPKSKASKPKEPSDEDFYPEGA